MLRMLDSECATPHDALTCRIWTATMAIDDCLYMLEKHSFEDRSYYGYVQMSEEYAHVDTALKENMFALHLLSSAERTYLVTGSPLTRCS